MWEAIACPLGGRGALGETLWDPRAGLLSANHKLWKPQNICTTGWVIGIKCFLACKLSTTKENKLKAFQSNYQEEWS